MVNGWLGWQIDYLLYLQNFRDISGHVLDKFFIYITMCGEVIIPWLVISLFYWVINKKTGQFILWSYLFGFIANTLAKVTACIYRPWILDSRVCPLKEAIPAATGYSFPSGHTAGVMSTWGGIAVSYWNNKLLRYSCIFIIISVMISRNYLGVHTPQDVIVSFLISCVLLYCTKLLVDWEEKEKNRDLIILGAVCLVMFLTILYVIFKSYPIHYLFGKILYDPTSSNHTVIMRSGFVFGSFLGWVFEKRYIEFIPEIGTITRKILRMIIGIGIMTILYHFDFVLFTPIVSGFIKMFVMGLFMTCIYPWIIKKCQI